MLILWILKKLYNNDKRAILDTNGSWPHLLLQNTLRRKEDDFAKELIEYYNRSYA